MEKVRSKKLIAVTARAPYPLNSGGRIATYNTLISLNKKYDIKLYIITDEKIDERAKIHLENKFGNVVIWKKSKFSSYFDSVKFLISGKPMQVGYFYCRKLKEKIEKDNDLNSNYFISFVLRTASYGKNFKSKKFIYSIDSMYLNYKNSVKNTNNLLWKCIYKIESTLLRKFETSIVNSYTKISYVNPIEAEFWGKQGVVKCIPHGLPKVNYANVDIDLSYKNSIIFIGRMDYQPNITAVEWFIKNVVGQLNNEITFTVIGGYVSDKLIKKYSQKRVHFTGFVENPDVIIKSSLCSVAPMLTGGGLQTKILKSFSLGNIVVMSDLASKPIVDFVDRTHGYVANYPEEYIEIIHKIFNDRNSNDFIRENSIELFLRNYENSKIENRILEFFV